MITITNDRARQAALAYHAAWARRDLDGALDQVSDDVVCDTPSGRVEGILGFVDLVSGQLRGLERTRLVAAFGDDTTAVLIHEDQTLAGPARRAALSVTVEDGRIAYMRMRRVP